MGFFADGNTRGAGTCDYCDAAFEFADEAGGIDGGVNIIVDLWFF